MADLPVVDVHRAAEAIARGEVVAFPTETYYGLAVDALDETALARLFDLKEREARKASALLVASWAMFAGLCRELPSAAQRMARTYWPGPLTIALPARLDLPSGIVTDGFVAARVSPHPVAQALVQAAGRPITATSANPSGAAPARRAADVAAYFAGRALLLLDGGETSGGPPSTLVRFRGESYEILRRGAIAL